MYVKCYYGINEKTTRRWLFNALLPNHLGNQFFVWVVLGNIINIVYRFIFIGKIPNDGLASKA